jgi:hypothetical protein
MTSYTNARPGAGLVVVDLDLGTRYPYGRRSGQGGAQTLKALHLEALLDASSLERLLAVDGELP